MSSSVRPQRVTAVALDAPAKVNLALRILEREPSGYHRIETVFQALALADRVQLELTDQSGITLEVRGEDAGPTQDNLVVRAARAFLVEARVQAGLHIRLDKRIPAGAGLGGGSSDAAATLRALGALVGELAQDRLSDVAVSLGADVPFFLCGSPLAIGRGRGEELVPLTPLPAAPVILALPRVHVSTAAAYAALDRQRAAPNAGSRSESSEVGPPFPGELRGWEAVEPIVSNDFEELTCLSHPEVARARDALRATGARFVLLSGSGAALFAVYPTDADAATAMDGLLPRRDTKYVLTRTATAVPVPEASTAVPPRG